MFNHLRIIILGLSIFLSSWTLPSSAVRASEGEDVNIEELARREAIRAANNPEEYERGIRDISENRGFGAMTVDMAKFYWAVAAVEFTHCLTSRDSTQCVQFMEGLKDPIGHIGFALFMKTNHMTVDMAMVLSRKRINPGMASYFGLAAGMMAQSIFQDLYYHPLTQELFRTNRIDDAESRKAARKDVLNRMWTHFKGNAGKYLFNKIPNVVGLLGAAYVSHKTVQAMEHIFGRSGRLVKFVFNKQTASTIMRFGRDLYKQRRLAKMGLKFVWNGSKLARVNPVVAIGSYFVETIVFLVWAPIIEEAVVEFWDQANAQVEITRGKSRMEHAAENLYSRNDVKEKAKEIAKGYDRFRESIMSKAEITKMRHLISIQKMDKEFQKYLMYYEWLAGTGMNRESDLYTLNEQEWHEDSLIASINEASDFAEGFFCGKSPYEAVDRTIDVRGLPVPGSYSFDFSRDMNRTHYENMMVNADGITRPTGIKLSPFKVSDMFGTCKNDMYAVDHGDIDWTGSYEDVMCPINFHPNAPDDQKIEYNTHKTYKLFCDVYMSQARHHILKTGRRRGQDVRDRMLDDLDEAAGKVMNKIWSQRDLMIMRYETAVRKELATGLTGKDASITRDGKVEYAWLNNRSSVVTGMRVLGFIPIIDEENEMWDEYIREYPRYASVFREIKEENRKKREAAVEIKRYNEMDYSQRVRRIDFFQEVPREDWEKVVHTLREYIVP